MIGKILIAIQLLLSTIFHGTCSIENNTTINKPRLMTNERYVDTNIVPNTGYLENIYINKYKTTAQTIDILNNPNLNYVLNPMEEQTETRRNDMYVVFCNSNLTKVLVILRNVYIGNGNFKPEEFVIQLFDYTNMTGQLVFVSDEVEFNGVSFFSGWQISSPKLIINSDIVSIVPNFEIPVGQQNNLLTDLFSINNVFVDMYSYNYGYGSGLEHGLTEGERNGYEAGYDEGYDEGYDIGKEVGIEQATGEGYEAGYEAGYDEGYDIGKEDGKNNTNPFGGFFEILESATSSMHNFFSVEILPNLTLSTLLGIFIALPLFVFFMKLISSK